MSGKNNKPPEKAVEEALTENGHDDDGGNPEVQESNVESIATRWTKRLMCSGGKGGAPKKTFANAVVALRYAPEWIGRLRYNGFSNAIFVEKALIWDDTKDFTPRQWNDHDNLKLTEWLQKNRIEVNKNIAADAVLMVAREKEYHPVREYFENIKWDGKERLTNWLRDYLGAEDNAYERMVGPKWVISAVARIMRPGCKADCVLIFIGDQGQGKSTALEKLVGKEWFTDEIRITGSKETPIAMAGKLLVEFSDLEGFHGRTAEELKAFLSRTTDRYRGLFGRYAEDHPRQLIFGGTTNQRTPLRDFTGNRRFWPVGTGTAKIEELIRDRDQLWAEAVMRFKAGEAWWLETPDERALADHMADEVRENDEWQSMVEDYCADKYEVRIVDILVEAIEIPLARINRSDQMRVAGILQVLKWLRVRKNVKGVRSWAYERKSFAKV